MVKIMNFIAEYSFLPVPQIEIKKNIGISSSSQNRKNRKKSKDVNTPMTAPCKTNSHMKCSFMRTETLHDAKTATIPRIPVSKTNGALSPSIPRK